MADVKHSELPWFVCDHAENDQWYEGRTIGSEPEGKRVCDMTWLVRDEYARANAEFIVRAVNCHDELVKALEDVVAIADRKTDEFDRARDALTKARATS